MIEKIQHATASSPEGARGLVKGVLACAFQNMAFMLPTGLLYLLVKDLLAGSASGRTAFYLLGCSCHIRANSPFCAHSSSFVPDSAICPSCTT